MNTSSTKPGLNKRGIRFSIRLLLVLTAISSILLGCLAFHLRRLDQQEAANEFLADHGCQTFIGDFDELTSNTTRTVSPNQMRAGNKKQFHYITMTRAKTTAQPPSGTMAQILGARFCRQDSIAWLSLKSDFEFEELVGNLKKMPWLKCVVLETILPNRGIMDSELQAEYDTEQCPLTEQQIEKLRSEFPDLKIHKSMFEQPST